METHFYIHHSLEFSWPLAVILVLVVACVVYPMAIEYQAGCACVQQDRPGEPRQPMGFRP